MNRKFSALVLIVLITAGLVATAGMVLDSMAAILGAVAFVLIAIPATLFLPSRRWLVISICGILVLAVTVVLYRLSANEIIIDNQSGQDVVEIDITPRNGNDWYRVGEIPSGTAGHFTFHDLLFNGKFNVAGGSLRDGSRLQSTLMDIEGKHYHGRIKILIEGGGKIRTIWSD
jgi:hypothetical protein